MVAHCLSEDTTMRKLAVFVALAFAAGAGHAQVFKCVDASGKTVYSQVPCPKSAKATTLERNAPPPPPPAAAAKGDTAKGAAAKATGPKTAAELEQDFRKRRQEQDEARKKEEQKLTEAREKEENCRNARTQLVSLDSGIRQTRVDERGERIFLEDAQVEAEKARARKAVDTWCK